jgi:hypothetical protein
MTTELQRLATDLAVTAAAERSEIEAATQRIHAKMNHRREQAITKVARNLPELSWWWNDDGSTVHARGQVGAGYYESEVPGIVKAWADALGLEIQTAGVIVDHGGVSAAGEADGIRVTVWGVVDRKRWKEEMRPRRESRSPSRTES